MLAKAQRPGSGVREPGFSLQLGGLQLGPPEPPTPAVSWCVRRGSAWSGHRGSGDPACPGGRDPCTLAGSGRRAAWRVWAWAGRDGTHVQVEVVAQEFEEGHAAVDSPLPLMCLLRRQPDVQVLQVMGAGRGAAACDPSSGQAPPPAQTTP